MIDSSGLSTSHKPNLCAFGHLKKYQQTTSGPSSAVAISSGGEKIGANLGRRVLGYTRQRASSCSTESSSDVDRVLSNGPGDLVAQSEVDSLMGGDVVALPNFSMSDDDDEKETKEEPVSRRGIEGAMLRRQDTFGDEFYENWDKAVIVEEGEEGSGSATTNLSPLPEKTGNGKGKGVKGKNKGGGQKRLRYHEAVMQEQQELEDDRLRQEEKKELKQQQNSATSVTRSAAAPPKMRKGKKK